MKKKISLGRKPGALVVWRSALGSGLMPIPDLCILECVITGYYKLMNVIVKWDSMYSPSACI